MASLCTAGPDLQKGCPLDRVGGHSRRSCRSTEQVSFSGDPTSSPPRLSHIAGRFAEGREAGAIDQGWTFYFFRPYNGCTAEVFARLPFVDWGRESVSFSDMAEYFFFQVFLGHTSQAGNPTGQVSHERLVMYLITVFPFPIRRLWLKLPSVVYYAAQFLPATR